MKCAYYGESITNLKILLLLCIKQYNLCKDLRKFLCSYLYVSCKCLEKPGCYICVDCVPEAFNYHPKICNFCIDHCCELCFGFEDEQKWVCERYNKEICMDCIAVCWCQCIECICKLCVKDKDIPICPKCDKKWEIPICEDGEMICENCNDL